MLQNSTRIENPFSQLQAQHALTLGQSSTSHVAPTRIHKIILTCTDQRLPFKRLRRDNGNGGKLHEMASFLCCMTIQLGPWTLLESTWCFIFTGEHNVALKQNARKLFACAVRSLTLPQVHAQQQEQPHATLPSASPTSLHWSHAH